MVAISPVTELVLRYCELRSNGEAVTPESVCVQRPDLVAEVKRQVHILDRLQSHDAGTLDEATQIFAVTSPSQPLPQIPNHQILGVLGEGGMGIVYKAMHLGLRRVVAVKMISTAERTTAAHLARFRAEAEAVAKLQHPNIVQVFEIGEVDGKPYFTLEFVEGGSLDKRLKNGPLPPRQAALIVETLANAMHFAHEKNIVHRDLKPANILLTTGKVTFKITDFGLAKQLSEQRGVTASGAVMGTPSYMAPEQAEGKLEDIGPRTDIYALGAILYELLTGRPPFVSSRVVETLDQVRNQEPVPPRRLQPSISKDLETICLKCLMKSTAKRYANAGALAGDLRCFLRGEPIAARPIGALERSWMWARRRPALAATWGLSVLALILVIGGSGAWWNWAEAASARDQLTLEKEKTELALTQEKTAKEGERKAREELASVSYVHRFQLARESWRAGETARTSELLDGCELRHRGWEWRFLKRSVLGAGSVLTNVTDIGLCIAFAPNGKQIASGDSGGKVRLVSLDGHPEITFEGHSSFIYVTSICFSKNGERLASGSGDGTVKVWDLLTRKVAFAFGQVDALEGVTSVCFSPDGKWLACAKWNKTVSVYDLQTGKTLQVLKQDNAVQTVHFSPDGKRLATGGQDGVVAFLDSSTWEPIFSTKGHDGGVRNVAFNADNIHLCSTGDDGSIIVWDTVNKTRKRVFPTKTVRFAAFSPDGNLIAGADDKIARVWEVATGREIRAFRGHTKYVGSLCFRPDGQLLATASSDKTVRLWSIFDDPIVRTLAGHENLVSSISFSPDGTHLAVGCWDKTVSVWQTRQTRKALILQGHTSAVTDVCYSRDGHLLASAAGDPMIDSVPGEVIIWNAVTGAAILTMRGHKGPITGLCFHPDGTTLATSSFDASVKIWNVANGAEIATLIGHAGWVCGLCFSPDGSQLASVGVDRTVRVWDPLAGKQTMLLAGHVDIVSSVAFSPDGKLLVTGSGHVFSTKPIDAKVWNAKSGQCIHDLTGHSSFPICGVCFSPDSRRIGSVNSAGIVKLWDVQTGLEVLAIENQAAFGAGASIRFSPDGKCLAIPGPDLSVQVLNAEESR